MTTIAVRVNLPGYDSFSVTLSNPEGGVVEDRYDAYNFHWLDANGRAKRHAACEALDVRSHDLRGVD